MGSCGTGEGVRTLWCEGVEAIETFNVVLLRTGVVRIGISSPSPESMEPELGCRIYPGISYKKEDVADESQVEEGRLNMLSTMHTQNKET